MEPQKSLEDIREKFERWRATRKNRSERIPAALWQSAAVLAQDYPLHGRRHFIDIMADFPEECRHVIDTLSLIYKHDQEAKEQNLTAGQRLTYHQRHSRPLMQALKTWLETKLGQREVEPNASLGKAMKYMIKNWDALTRFLDVPGAPLGNNLCEQDSSSEKLSVLQNRARGLYRRFVYEPDPYLQCMT
jgi:hypothetical protein